jgi:DNA-binding CsgD family transcriptional regulator
VKRTLPFLAILVVQALCAFFFVSDILSSFIGLQTAPISWEMRELLEIFAAFGLILGVVLGAVLLRRALRERHKAEEQLRRASGAFKGLSTSEIAGLRSTSEGTVKAQTNAIYRKAGVSGRSQLLSLFIEDLMRDDGAVRPMPQAAPQATVSAK